MLYPGNKKLRLSISIKRRSITPRFHSCRGLLTIALHSHTRNVCNPVSGYLKSLSPDRLPDALHRPSTMSCFQPAAASLCRYHNLLLFPFLVFAMYVISYAKKEDLSIAIRVKIRRLPSFPLPRKTDRRASNHGHGRSPGTPESHTRAFPRGCR